MGKKAKPQAAHLVLYTVGGTPTGVPKGLKRQTDRQTRIYHAQARSKLASRNDNVWMKDGSGYIEYQQK
jgi:hypothetical protein